MLTQAFVYLCAAVLAVPFAKRLGLGSVLGYLIAGVAIGPYALGLVGEKGADVMHASELGVVMMLFLIGLELQPSLLWQMRRPILGLGGSQVLGTTVVVAALALALGYTLPVALTVGMIASASSTAIVLQSLSEKGLLRGEGGQASFAVLLFQDIAVIPMLAVLPLLAVSGADGVAVGAHGAERPGWVQALLILGAVGGIVAGGRFLVRPFFRMLARTRLREIFTAAALLLVVGIAVLMEKVGLSPALGTFLAGVVLAESEYRHELESDIEPFKGLLLGLFFISVGATIDFGLIMANPQGVAALVAGLFAVKMVVLYVLGRVFGLARPARWLLTFAVSQGGEFAFVLLSVALGARVLLPEVAGTLVAVVALSMLVTPLVLMAFERLVAPRLAQPEGEARAADELPAHEAPIVVAGYGRFGQITGRLLRGRGFHTTVLDLDVELLETLGRVGVKAYYGDASRLELLHAAGCERARLFVLAVDEVEKSLEIAGTVRKHFPKLRIIARARNREHYYALRRLGVTDIFRETFGSAVDAGAAALVALGHRSHQARRIAAAFRAHDEATLERLSDLWNPDDQSAYFAAAKRAREDVEALLRGDLRPEDATDLGWDTASLRADLGARPPPSA